MASKKNEAQIKFSANTTEFDNAIKKSNREIGDMTSALKLNSSQMKTNGESVKSLEERNKLLQKQLDANKEKTQALNSKIEEAKKIFGEDSEEVSKLTRQLNSSLSAEQRIQGEINKTNDKLKENEKHFKLSEKAAEKFKSTNEKIAKGSAAVITAIGGIGAASVAAYKEVDDGADNIIRATGATGEQAKELEQVYDNVLDSIVTDFDSAGSAIGEINTRFGFTDKVLEDASVKFIQFSNILGTDATNAVQLVSKYMENANIDSSEYADVLDKVTKACQNSGIGFDTLMQSLTTNGASMRALGFDANESISLLAQFEKSGVNSSVALTGMKKAMANWSKEGKNANKEFEQVLKQIKNAPNDTKAAQIAVETFGSKAGPELADAIKKGKFEYGEFLKQVKKSKGTVDGTFNEMLDETDEAELALQRCKVAVSKVGGTLLKQLAPHIETIAEKASDFITYAEEHGDEIIDKITTIGKVALTAFAVSKVMTFVSGLSAMVQGAKAAVSGIKSVSTAISTMSSASKATAIGAIAGVIALIASAASSSSSSIEEMEQNIEDSINRTEELKKSFNDSVSTALIEGNELQEYADELKTIVDENGKIQEGQEERAELITGKLKDAMDLEIETTDGIVKGWKNISKSIDEYIEKKKVQIMLDSGEDEYIEAKKKQKEQGGKIVEAQGKYDSAKRFLDDYSNSSLEYKLTHFDLYFKYKDEMDTAEEEYNALVNEYSNATGIVNNYEHLLEASVSGSQESIDGAMTAYTYSLKYATDTTYTELQAQVDYWKDYYEKLKTAHDNGMVGVTQEMVGGAYSAYTFSKNQLAAHPYSMKKQQLDNILLNPLEPKLPFQTNALGSIVSRPTLTWVAEAGDDESIIPINNKPRSRELFYETGRRMGLISDYVQPSVNKAVSLSETNRLLSAILNKQNYIGIDGRIVGQTMAGHTDNAQGYVSMLTERGMVY